MMLRNIVLSPTARDHHDEDRCRSLGAAGTARRSLGAAGTARPSFGGRVSDTGTLATAAPVYPHANLLYLPLQADKLELFVRRSSRHLRSMKTKKFIKLCS